ncbi:MAG: hypothetical protein ABIM44_08400, partial [candidate division WOR-3 bacterium]
MRESKIIYVVFKGFYGDECLGSEEGKTIRDRLDRLIKEGERIAGKFKNEADKIKKSIENEEVMFTLLEGFDGVDKAVNELCEKLKDS